MTARAELYGEHTCSDCRGLVLHGDASAAPTCRRCERVVCARCEVLGMCVACALEAYHPPFEALDGVDDEQLVVVDGESVPGRRAVSEGQSPSQSATPRHIGVRLTA